MLGPLLPTAWPDQCLAHFRARSSCYFWKNLFNALPLPEACWARRQAPRLKERASGRSGSKTRDGCWLPPSLAVLRVQLPVDPLKCPWVLPWGQGRGSKSKSLPWAGSHTWSPHASAPGLEHKSPTTKPEGKIGGWLPYSPPPWRPVLSFWDLLYAILTSWRAQYPVWSKLCLSWARTHILESDVQKETSPNKAKACPLTGFPCPPRLSSTDFFDKLPHSSADCRSQRAWFSSTQDTVSLEC